MEIEGYFIYESEVDHMKKNICTTAEEIKKKFIDDGWSKDISFYELTLEEAKEKGYLFAVDGINKGQKFFVMNGNGNIYKNNGEIACFNIPAKRQ